MTAPKTERCECLACVTNWYVHRLESVRERENEALELLHDARLCEWLKNGNAQVDFHAKSRFAILMNVVSDPIVKIKVVKKLILDESFDLDLLDVKTVEYYNNSSRFESIITRQFGLYSYGTLMKNAVVYRHMPELLEHRIVSFEREKVVAYAKAIAALGYNFYKDFFGDCPQREKLQITSMLFDQYLSNGHENLIRPIQELFALITNLEGRELADGLPKAYTELANKILLEGNHECLPFKTRNYGAKSLSEYLQISQKNNRVKERLRGMSDLSPLERLKFIVQSEHTIYYYPHFALENIWEEVDLLTDEDRSKLLEKLQIVNRGPLRDLKNYLNCNQ